MASSEILKELFVKVSYVIDDQSERKLTDSTRKAVLQANLLYDALVKGAQMFAKAMAQVATGLDQMFYASNRIGASVGNIKAYTNAMANLGSSVEGGMAALEAFGRFVRTQPGGLNFVASVGVQTKDSRGKTRDMSDIMDDYVSSINKKYKNNYPLQLKFAEMVGMSEREWLAHSSPEYGAQKGEQRSFFKKIGLDPDEAKKTGREFMNTMRDIGNIAEVMMSKVMVNFLGKGDDGLTGLKNFLLAHGSKITEAITAILNVIVRLGQQFVVFLEEQAKKNGGFDKYFEKVATSITSAATSTANLVSNLNKLFDVIVKIYEYSPAGMIHKKVIGAVFGSDGASPGGVISGPSGGEDYGSGLGIGGAIKRGLGKMLGVGGAQAAPYVGNVHAAGAGPGGSYVFGDSLGQGIQGALGAPGMTKQGISPAAVLKMIQGADVNALHGKNIILSSGASNDPAAAGMLQAQLEALRAKGVDPSRITVVGVGNRKDFAGVNDTLKGIAGKFGARFAPLGRNIGSDGVHMKSYSAFVRNVLGGGAVNSFFTKENADAVRGAAAKLGTSPEDLATVIAYETGGSFNPWQRGPTTKWGQHRGLIQFGEPQRQRYGVHQSQSFVDQMDSVVDYMRQNGFKPGMGLLDLYSIINAGGPGRYNASDGNGTVRSHVARMVRERGAQALRFLASGAVDAPGARMGGVMGLRAAAARMRSMPGFGAGMNGLNFTPADRSLFDAPAPGAAGGRQSFNASGISASQQTSINIHGVTGPHEVASALEAQQRRKNRELATLLRNTVGVAS